MKYCQTKMLIYEVFVHMLPYQPLLIQSSFDTQGPIRNYLTMTNTDNQLHYYVQLEICAHPVIQSLQTRFSHRHCLLLFNFQ